MISETQKQLLFVLSKGLSLNKQNRTESIEYNVGSFYHEALEQTVFLMAYMQSLKKEDNHLLSQWDRDYSAIIANNLRVEFEHNEVHELLTRNQIPYTIIKGCASAHYYPNPSLRTLGDVDFLINKSDARKVNWILEKNGFLMLTQDADYHDEYTREPNSVWEAHKSIKGIPQDGIIGATIRQYLSDTIETSVVIKNGFGECRIPDHFHHGLIMLLHIASHLTATGVGLRHLCDWATFYSHFSENEFCILFESKLKKIGLWRFARILTLVSIKYLNTPVVEWAGEEDDEVLSELIEDILRGGNFGNKEVDRPNQVKFIANQRNGTVDRKSPIKQVLYTLDAKTTSTYPIVKRVWLLRPFAWGIIGARFAYAMVAGKRKFGSLNTISEANKRKRIYSALHIFDTEES